MTPFLLFQYILAFACGIATFAIMVAIAIYIMDTIVNKITGDSK